MKKIAVIVLVLVVAAMAKYLNNPNEFRPYLIKAGEWAQRIRSNAESNPVPIVIAIGTFVFTCIYHKARGKSFRDAVEVAATRVTVIPAAPAASAATVETEPVNPVLMRAYARTTRTQLLADQTVLKVRINTLPDEVKTAEKEFCFAEKQVLEAKRVLGEKHKARNLVTNKLASLREQLNDGRKEIDAIESELTKLAEYV